MFEKSITLDPQYAAAYPLQSQTYVADWIWQWNQNPQTVEQAFVLAQRAVALDDFLPLTHIVLSQVYKLKNQHDQAITEGERAVTLDPNDPEGYVQLAGILAPAGRAEEAIESAKKATRLNPHYPPRYIVALGGAYHQAWHNEEAIAT